MVLNMMLNFDDFGHAEVLMILLDVGVLVIMVDYDGFEDDAGF